MKNLIKNADDFEPNFGKSDAEPSFARPQASSKLPPGIVDSGDSKFPITSRKSPAIATMQKSLIALSKDILDNIPTEKSNEDTIEKNENAHAFLDFIAKKTNNAAMVGKQLLETDVSQPVRMETGKANDKFKGLIQSLSHIGSPISGEQIADGEWGSRTTNALRQVYALGSQLLNAARDIGIQISGYGETELQNLLSLLKTLPEKGGPPPTEQDALATAITANIERFRKYFTDFKDKILNDRSFQPLINQDKPLISHKNDQLNPQESAQYQAFGGQDLWTSLNGNRVSIKPANLLNMAQFKTWLSSVGPLLPNEQLQKALTDNGAASFLLKEVMQNLQRMA